MGVGKQMSEAIGLLGITCALVAISIALTNIAKQLHMIAEVMNKLMDEK
jgi:hypothetical protein